MKKIVLTLGALALGSVSFAQTTLFDQESSIVPVTGAYGQFTQTYGPGFSSTNANDLYNQAGENINLGSAGATINGLDFLYVTGGNIGSTDDISVVVNVYSKFTNSTSSGSAEYSGLLSTTTIDLGTGFLGNYIYGATADFDASGNFTGPNNNYALNPAITTGSQVGITFTFLDNGAATENVGIAFDAGLADLVGSNANSGLDVFYANNAASTHNLTGKSAIGDGGTELDLAMTLYGTPAPEPVSMTFLGLGVAGLIAKRRKVSK